MTNRHFTSLALVLVLLFSMWIVSCTEDNNQGTDHPTLVADYDATLSLKWYQLLLEIDRYSPGYRPPAAARMLAYTGLAAYEAGVPGMPTYNSLKYEYNGLDIPNVDAALDYHWPSAINAAYAAMFRHYYPHIRADHKARIDALENEFKTEYSTAASSEVINRSIAYGQAVADAVYDFSTTDAAGHEAYLNPRPSSYVPPATGPNGEKLWQPTFPDYTPALFPYWGQVRTFAMSSSDIVAQPPLPYSEDPGSLFISKPMKPVFWQTWDPILPNGWQNSGVMIFSNSPSSLLLARSLSLISSSNRKRSIWKNHSNSTPNWVCRFVM